MSEEKKQEIQKAEEPMSARFTNAVIREFTANVGDMSLGPYERTLAQHLFIKIEIAMAEAEKKRPYGKNKDKKSITWPNVNMAKLANDAVYRIQLGLDALIENHIHVIPWWNSRHERWDIELRVGYVGKDFYRRAIAEDQSVQTVYELVYETDKFIPKKKSASNPFDTYEFEIVNPFNRGQIIGGFGYISYGDSSKNLLVLVTPGDFEKSKQKAGTNDFWGDGKYPENMKYKTIVHRTTEKIKIDPKKASKAMAAVESPDNDIEREIDENANQIPINIPVEMVDTETGEILNEDPGQSVQHQLTNQPEPVTLEMPKQPEQELVGAGTSTGGGNGGSVRRPGF